MAGKRLRVGNFDQNVDRKAPTKERFEKWMKEFLNSPKLKDYDAYLWGSWPDKKTKDIDILLTKGEGVGINTAEMEELSLLNLEKSLVENNMLVDLGFTDEKVTPFKEAMDIYKKTGKPIPRNGYTYGSKWYIDDKKVKDRTKWLGPSVEELPNNIVKLGGAIPYAKQLSNIDNFEKVYGHKPIKIKSKD